MRVAILAAIGLLLGGATPVAALDISIGDTSVSLGGGDGGGVSASVSTGDVSVGASAGGGGGISATASAGGNTVAGAVAGNGGSLLSATSGGGTTAASANLGGVLEGLLSAPGENFDALLAGIDPNTALLSPGPRGSAAEQFRSSFNRLPFVKKRQARLSCRTVLSNPAAYDTSVRQLCMLIARI